MVIAPDPPVLLFMSPVLTLLPEITSAVVTLLPEIAYVVDPPVPIIAPVVLLLDPEIERVVGMLPEPEGAPLAVVAWLDGGPPLAPLPVLSIAEPDRFGVVVPPLEFTPRRA